MKLLSGRRLAAKNRITPKLSAIRDCPFFRSYRALDQGGSGTLKLSRAHGWRRDAVASRLWHFQANLNSISPCLSVIRDCHFAISHICMSHEWALSGKAIFQDFLTRRLQAAHLLGGFIPHTGLPAIQLQNRETQLGTGMPPLAHPIRDRHLIPRVCMHVSRG
jgi:hypothetical protein